MMKPRSAGCRRQDIFDYSRERYGTEPEALWATAPDYAVLRRADNHKWYALILRIPRKKVGLPGEDLIDVLEIKRDPAFASEEIDGIPVLPPYHMNKLHWIALPLDGSMPMETARFMLDLSYTLTGPKRRSASPKKEIHDWLVPANPKYFDIEAAFRKNKQILWKQSSRIAVGDMVYFYVAAPVSAICYQCRAIEVDLPCEKHDGHILMHQLMKVELLHRFSKENLDLEVLKRYGITTVRGPRGIPNSLMAEIQRVLKKEAD